MIQDAFPIGGDLVDSLIYINYRHNREISPHISPERWARVYGQSTPQMEARYQAGLAIQKAAS